MVGRGDAVAILLHGLPFPDQPNPLDQLTEIRVAIEAYIPPSNVLSYEWLADLRPPASRNATVSALLGRLGATIARDSRFEETMARALDEYERVVIVGYSTGGWIFYDWLATASAAQRQHIVIAFAIGAPYQNVRDHLYFGDSNEPSRARLWHDLSIDVLARALTEGRLHTVLSSTDRTVWPDNARFPKEYREQGLVRELVLSDVRHRQLPHDPQVLAYLRTAIAANLHS